MDRRQFLASTAVLLAAPRLARWERRRTRLVLLGTAGGPRPHKTRAAPAQAIVVNDTVYVVDCGNGVARQLVFADLPLSSVRHIFITHHHSDHNADYGNLILLAWAAGLRTRLDAWGPPPLERMTDLFFAMNATDISARTGDEGRMPLRPLVHAHDVRGGGPVMHDDNVRVTAAVVHHPPMVPAFAYRFDAEDRSIVISGDTTPSESLVALARNADILVHEALFDAASVDRLVARAPNASDPPMDRSVTAREAACEVRRPRYRISS